MNCKTCGKEFKSNDKRVKNCDKCRSKSKEDDVEKVKTISDIINEQHKNHLKLMRKIKLRYILMNAGWILAVINTVAIIVLFIVK